MNAALAFAKHPGSGCLAAGGAYGLSLCDLLTPYLRTLSLFLAVVCAILSIVDWIDRRQARRRRDRDELEERAHLHFLEHNEPDPDDQ